MKPNKKPAKAATKVSAKTAGHKPTSVNFTASPRLWFYLALVLLAVSVLRTIRFPSNFTYTTFLFNYDFGFIPRGLLGEVFSFFGDAFWRSYEFFAALSLIILFANLFLLAEHIRRLINSRHPLFIGCALVFAGSIATAYLSYIVGYFDQIGLLVTLLCFRMRDFSHKIIFAAVAAGVMLFIHEAFLLLFFPLLFVDLWLSADKRRAWHLPAVAAFSVWMLGLSFVVAQAGVFDEAVMHEAIEAYSAEVGHLVSPGAAAHIFYYDLETEMTYRANVWNTIQGFGEVFLSVAVLAPMTAIFLWTANRLLRQLASPAELRWLFLSAPLAPALLHIVGIDLHRWNMWIAINSFLLLSLIFSRRAEWSLPLPKMWLAIVCLLIFTGAGALPLWEEQTIKNFPFAEHAAYLTNSLTGDHPFFPSVPPTEH